VAGYRSHRISSGNRDRRNDPCRRRGRADRSDGSDHGLQCGGGSGGYRYVDGAEFGGLTLTPGVYFFASLAQLTGKLTLNNLGNPNALFVFQIGSTLTTASASSAIFSNSLTDSNVYWQVGSSATLGTTTAFQGNILALTSITLDTGASIGCGSALARNGAVTLDDNVIGGACSTSGGGGTSTVPEPGTLGLLGTGLVLLAGAARRKIRI
jgi:ice-binding like protein/PEP-CTERM motif-containing protein